MRFSTLFGAIPRLPVPLRLPMLAAPLAMGLGGCGGGGGSSAQKAFCSDLGDYAERCEVGMCTDTLVEDCSSFAGIANGTFLDATRRCLDTDGALGRCLVSGARATEPTEAHREFADAFCEGCASFGADQCKSAFFDESGDNAIAGALVLPLGEAVLERLADDCTGGTACATFPSCVQNAIIDEGLPEQSVRCFVDSIREDEAEPPMCAARDGGTSFDGGTLPDPKDAGSGADDDAGGEEDAGIECAPGLMACGGACVDTATDTDHCGGCDHGCFPEEDCVEGECVGECTCDPANARGRCEDDACVLVECDDGFEDCDGSDATGCEGDFRHDNTCETADEVFEAACGDESCGTGCGGTNWRTFASRSGEQSRWIWARAEECSRCNADISHRLRLEVEADVDYDLYVYSSCGDLWDSSTEGGMGEDEELVITADDRRFRDDDFDYRIEVRHQQGCGGWSLDIDGRARGEGDPTEGC